MLLLLSYLAPALACCGQLDQALSLRDEAVAEAREHFARGHARTHALGCLVVRVGVLIPNLQPCCRTWTNL